MGKTRDQYAPWNVVIPAREHIKQGGVILAGNFSLGPDVQAVGGRVGYMVIRKGDVVFRHKMAHYAALWVAHRAWDKLKAAVQGLKEQGT
jgi:hypothetical protein